MKKKLKKLVKMFPIVFVMGGTITGIMTYVNVGYNQDFYYAWLKSFCVVAFVIMPIASFFMDKLAIWIEEKYKHKKYIIKKIYFAVIMGTTIESIMAIGTTITNKGINSDFIVNWFHAFIFALPVGIILGFIMGVFVIPRLHKFLNS